MLLSGEDREWKNVTTFCVLSYHSNVSAQLIKHYAMRTYGRVDIWLHVFQTSAIVEGELLASSSCRLTPR
jgi:hypothetical protein